MSELGQDSTSEKRRHDAARAWGRFLGLDFLSNARHQRRLPDGSVHRDGMQDGATGDGANLFVLVKDADGINAVKIGGGEFSPRTFLEDDNSGYYEDAHRGHYRYATKMQPLLARTAVFVVEQDDGYFGLRPGDKRAELILADPQAFMQMYARMAAHGTTVDFNRDQRWNERFQTQPVPGFMTEHGGLIEFTGELMEPISIEDFEASLDVSRAQFVGATALS